MSENFFSEDTSRLFGPLFAELIAAAPPSELGPGTPNAAARAKLEAMKIESAFAGKKIVDRQMAELCLAGIWLMHNYLDESHTISQSIETPSGSYWHGIMHRREPDYANAKYWFRRVPTHPTYKTMRVNGQSHSPPALAADALRLDENPWRSLIFVDLCERAETFDDPNLARWCCRMQQIEYAALFAECFRAAIGADLD